MMLSYLAVLIKIVKIIIMITILIMMTASENARVGNV